MPKLTKKSYPSRTYVRTDPNYRKALLLKTYSECNTKILSLRIRELFIKTSIVYLLNVYLPGVDRRGATCNIQPIGLIS